MLCSTCGMTVQDGDHFCNNCGASLQAPGNITAHPPRNARPSKSTSPALPRRHTPGQARQRDPYRDQIAQLRLQLKEMRLQLRELNNQIRGTRSNYFELDSFAQRGPINRIGRMVEGAQLFGPYQQRKQLQDQVMQLEQQLLSLEKAQEQWRLQQQQMTDMNGSGQI